MSELERMFQDEGKKYMANKSKTSPAGRILILLVPILAFATAVIVRFVPYIWFKITEFIDSMPWR